MNAVTYELTKQRKSETMEQASLKNTRNKVESNTTNRST